MIAILTAACCLATGALFDVYEIPFETPGAQCFVAASDNDGIADLFVLAGNRITIYKNAQSQAVQRVILAPDTSAVDVADTDDDGANELVAVCGDRLLRYELDPGAASEPVELFRRETQLSMRGGRPYPHVLVVRREGIPLLALPCESTFELRTVSGELVAAHPIGTDAPRYVMYGRPFSSSNVDPPLVGAPDALEFRVSRVIAVEPSLPPDLLPVEAQGPLLRRGTPRQARDAAALEPDAWPWFPVRADGSNRARALYALSGTGLGDTLIRMQQPATGTEGASGEIRVGPRRRYPGVLLLSEDDLPDFNGDGYTDLLLWNSPDPTPTVNTLSRAVVDGHWPIRLTVHLFSPEKERFAPQPAAQLSLVVPVVWFLGGSGRAPVQHMVLRDLDGDKATDLACSVAPQEYAVWRWTKNGFPQTPDFRTVLTERIVAVEQRIDLDGGGRTSIILRGESKLFVLKASPMSVTAPSPDQSATTSLERPLGAPAP